MSSVDGVLLRSSNYDPPIQSHASKGRERVTIDPKFMATFVIEDDGDVKETFQYERPLNRDSLHALLQYARANYGPGAVVREVTAEGKTESEATDW
jgi:hypothetical protein